MNVAGVLACSGVCIVVHVRTGFTYVMRCISARISHMHALTEFDGVICFVLGVINASPIEYHAMTVALNTSSSFERVPN